MLMSIPDDALVGGDLGDGSSLGGGADGKPPSNCPTPSGSQQQQPPPTGGMSSGPDATDVDSFLTEIKEDPSGGRILKFLPAAYSSLPNTCRTLYIKTGHIVANQKT